MKGLVIIATLAACGGPTRHVESTTTAQMQGKAKRDPVNPAAYKDFEAAMRAERLGGPEANETARDRLRAALKTDSKIWEAWFDLGTIAWKEGDDDEAVDDFTKVLAINANHTASLMARAEANRRGGHKKEARADYEAAIKAMDDDDPNRRDTAAREASLLRDNGDFDDAVEILRDTVRTAGINAKIYTELGQIYLAQKRLELAQLVLTKAVQLDAKDPAVYNALAMLALRQGKAQESFQLFDQAASMDANYIDARFNKASVLLDAGDYARAKVELAAIVEKRPDDYAAAVALGVAHRGLKEFPDAKKQWERVLKEAPKKSDAHIDALWDLAILKIDFMEDQAGGKADLERYLQEAPSGHSRRQDAENKCKEVKCH
ncbi:MAG TPA: tetratricopeptide repeat protein [Kofleriaceae bacterium]|nr:tetratricopeptide repeat protein [Kofleriaceae bacterium]